MKIYESAEDYLETILILQNRLGSVRSIDIVNELDFSRASVSVAMKKLRESGHVEMDANGCITLTENGLKIAEQIYERHTCLADFLTSLGVNEQTALADACRMEHIISQQSFEKICEYIKKQ